MSNFNLNQNGVLNFGGDHKVEVVGERFDKNGDPEIGSVVMTKSCADKILSGEKVKVMDHVTVIFGDDRGIDHDIDFLLIEEDNENGFEVVQDDDESYSSEDNDYTFTLGKENAICGRERFEKDQFTFLSILGILDQVSEYIELEVVDLNSTEIKIVFEDDPIEVVISKDFIKCEEKEIEFGLFDSWNRNENIRLMIGYINQIRK